MEWEPLLLAVKQIGLPATVALLGFAWAFWERKENKALTAQLMELAKANIELAYKQEAAIEHLRQGLLK